MGLWGEKKGVLDSWKRTRPESGSKQIEDCFLMTQSHHLEILTPHLSEVIIKAEGVCVWGGANNLVKAPVFLYHIYIASPCYFLVFGFSSIFFLSLLQTVPITGDPGNTPGAQS